MVNKDILLTSFFFNAEQNASLHENVDSTERGLANKHLIVQITACSARDYRDRNEQIDLLPPKSHISKTKDKSQAQRVSAESRKSGVYTVLQNKCQQHYLKKPAPARCVIFVIESFQFAEPDDSMGTLCVWVSLGHPDSVYVRFKKKTEQPWKQGEKCTSCFLAVRRLH